jgi:hypothetical protein
MLELTDLRNFASYLIFIQWIEGKRRGYEEGKDGTNEERKKGENEGN